MTIGNVLGGAVLMALVSTGALAQSNSPTDPAPPAGCTGFPGESAACDRQVPADSNTTIPEEPSAPDINTESGAQEPLPSPGNNDESGTQQDLPNGASPDNPTTNPDADGAVD